MAPEKKQAAAQAEVRAAGAAQVPAMAAPERADVVPAPR
jgi:hypothetical protein